MGGCITSGSIENLGWPCKTVVIVPPRGKDEVIIGTRDEILAKRRALGLDLNNDDQLPTSSHE